MLLLVGAGALYRGLLEDYAPETEFVEDESGQNEQDDVEINNEASNMAVDFTVENAAGEEVTLSSFIGKPIVLNFWATWCYYCRVEMGDFNTAYRENPDVVFLMINATDGVRETVWTAHEYIRGEGYEFLVYFDTEGTALSKYGVAGLPTTVFIDKEGNIVSRANGMLDLETLKQGIERITEE